MVKIRKMEISDIDKVVFLEQTVLGETLGRKMLTDEINNPFIHFLVIEKDGVIIGYISGSVYLEDGEIFNFVIDGAYQHQGYGQALFDALLETFNMAILKRLTLEVRADNIKALKFYRKNNFKQISVRKHYYQDGTDALVMIREQNENISD